MTTFLPFLLNTIDVFRVSCKYFNTYFSSFLVAVRIRRGTRCAYVLLNESYSPDSVAILIDVTAKGKW